MITVKPFHITRKYEHKKFVQFQESLTKKKSSYSSFIITSDKKLILCKRSSSFYFSHMTSIFARLLRKGELLKDDSVRVIMSYIVHFKEAELITFLLWLNTYYDILTGLSKAEFHMLGNGADATSLQFLRPDILVLLNNKYFIHSIRKVASSFMRSMFDGEINEFFSTNNDPVYVLPGGRSSSLDSGTKDTLFREVREEIGYDMYSNDIKIVSNDFSIDALTDTLTPILVCTTTDKVFNRYFIEYISIVFIPTTSQEIIKSFKPNREVSSILLLDVKNEVETMFAEKTVTPLLHVFKRV